METRIIGLLIITTLSINLRAQNVTFHYPGEGYKTSEDNGLTWVVRDERPAKVCFNYPFGVSKTTCDQGRTWTVTKAMFRFVYPDEQGVQKGEGALHAGLSGQPFTLYPNPAAGQVTVDLPTDGAAAYLITIMGMDGRVYKQAVHPGGDTGRMVVDLGGMDGGTYLMSLMADDRVVGHQCLVINP